MYKTGHGDESLRRHRISVPGATYFLTLCLKNRTTGLNENPVVENVQKEISSIESDGHWQLCSAVIMPDHLHLLIRLVGALTVSRCVARLKAKTRSSILTANLEWQVNFFGHRLRSDEPIEPVLRYMFLNPYRANLIATDNVYPWFYLGQEDALWFKPSLNNDAPYPEWLIP